MIFKNNRIYERIKIIHFPYLALQEAVDGNGTTVGVEGDGGEAGKGLVDLMTELFPNGVNHLPQVVNHCFSDELDHWRSILFFCICVESIIVASSVCKFDTDRRQPILDKLQIHQQTTCSAVPINKWVDAFKTEME